MKLRLCFNMSYKYLILFVSLILVSGCYHPPVSETTETVYESETVYEAPTEEAPAEDSGVNEVTVKASNYKFESNTINVKKGETLKITLFSEEGSHNMFIEGYNQKTDTISSSDIEIMEFVADQSGSFEYWCKVPGHKALGMKGVLIVE